MTSPRLPLVKAQRSFLSGIRLSREQHGPKVKVTAPPNKNHSYKHNEQINSQNIDNSECFGVKFVKIYPEMTSQ